MKITKSQLKQIIKEELGRTDYRTEFEIIARDLGEISRMTTPDALETGERIDVVLDQEDIEEIHAMATDALNTISQYITQMMREG